MDQFKDCALQLLNKVHASGLAIALVQNDHAHSTAFGYARLDPPTLLTTDLPFDIAFSPKSLFQPRSLC